MTLLILTFVIVLVIVGGIALLSPDQDTDRGTAFTGDSQNAPLAEGGQGEADTEWPVRMPSYHVDWVDAAASGKMFNLTGKDDEPGFYI